MNDVRAPSFANEAKGVASCISVSDRLFFYDVCLISLSLNLLDTAAVRSLSVSAVMAKVGGATNLLGHIADLFPP